MGKLVGKRLFWVGKILAGSLLAATIILAAVLAFLPSPWQLATYPYPASTLIFDRNGELLYEIYSEKNRIPVIPFSIGKTIIGKTITL